MTTEDKEKIKEEDKNIITNYCKGCIHFNSDKTLDLICSIMKLYKYIETKHLILSEFLIMLENCPCNKGCLVKAACRDIDCPDWSKYYYDNIKPISARLSIDLFRSKNKDKNKKK